MMDDTYRKSIRRVSTYQMALSDTGGFMTITFLLAAIIVQRLQATIYNSTLIKSFYKYQHSDCQPHLN
jgi:hypothetical protein